VKPIAEQIENIAAPAMTTARKLAGDLRYAEKELAKREGQVAKALKERDQTRIKLGQALVDSHKQMKIRQGDRSGRWAAFLAELDLDAETARRYMKLADATAELPSPDDDAREVPTYAEIGLDNRPRKTDREREEQPDYPERDAPDPELAADRAAVEEAGRVEVISPGTSDFNIRLGTWQSVLADIDMVDAVICDPPYGKRTHDAETTRYDGVDPHGLTPDYDHWTADNVAEFVESWASRNRGWFVCLTSDDLIPAWRASYELAGLTSFAPVACVTMNNAPRKQGDGPASWTVYAMMARPKNLSSWGSRPGAYVGPRVAGAKSGRGKPPWLMEAIVNDYTTPGDRVCDPFAGYGETLLAAWKLCRKGIGAEMVETARREAIQRFHQRKHLRLSDPTTFVPQKYAIASQFTVADSAA
jgi:hypothetical protein